MNDAPLESGLITTGCLLAGGALYLSKHVNGKWMSQPYDRRFWAMLGSAAKGAGINTIVCTDDNLQTQCAFIELVEETIAQFYRAYPNEKIQTIPSDA